MAVLLTILIGVHVLVVALARTAVQSAADVAVSAAQAAGDGHRENEGMLAAELALLGASSSVVATQQPVVVVERERGTVSVAVFGGVYTPVLGLLHVTGRACAPLDDIPVSKIPAPAAGQW